MLQKRFYRVRDAKRLESGDWEMQVYCECARRKMWRRIIVPWWKLSQWHIETLEAAGGAGVEIATSCLMPKGAVFVWREDRPPRPREYFT